MIRKTLFFILMLILVFSFSFCKKTESTTAGGEKLDTNKVYKIAWSHYTGWEPWEYANNSGILKKWADKFGLKIRLDLVNDYIESINLYTSGKYYACTMTNMDALTIPAMSGIDSQALIVGDYSNGNDGIVLRNANNFKDIKGRKLRIVEFSVSHYLLSRALIENKLAEKDVTLVNSSDADIAILYLTDPDENAAIVTWNPLLMKVKNEDNKANIVYDSSKIPGEIIDLMVIRTSAPEELKKALVGAWYETMSAMKKGSNKEKEAIEFMAKTAGGTVDEFKAQLTTTYMYYTANDALNFINSKDLEQTMDYVRTFLFDHKLYSTSATSKNFVGIEFPDGFIMGDKNNVKLRFTNIYTKLAFDNKL